MNILTSDGDQRIASLCLIAVFPVLTSGGSFQIKNIYDTTDSDTDHGSWHSSSLDQPQFVYQDSGNVSAIPGKSATLNCRVRAVGNRTVRIFEQ